jgi:hypothetical protein
MIPLRKAEKYAKSTTSIPHANPEQKYLAPVHHYD